MNRAFIILYTGATPDPDAQKAAAKAISTYIQDKDNITVVTLDDSEIAATLVNAIRTNDGFVKPTGSILFTKTNEVPELWAKEYITKRFSDKVANRDMFGFLIDIHEQARNSYNSIENTDVDLNRAILILSSNGAYGRLCPFSNPDEANLWRNIINVVKKVYQTVYV